MLSKASGVSMEKHSNGGQLALAPGLREILDLEKTIANEIEDVRSQALETINSAQMRVDSIQLEGQDRAKNEAALAVAQIQAKTKEQVDEIARLGQAESLELDKQLSSRLDHALVFIIDNVVEGESCVTGLGVKQC